jgi:hypothetical protein
MSQHSTGLARHERAGARPRERPVPGSWEDRSIDGFCRRHNWSRSTYENNRRRQTGPRETRTIAGGRVSISESAEIEFNAKFTS